MYERDVDGLGWIELVDRGGTLERPAAAEEWWSPGRALDLEGEYLAVRWRDVSNRMKFVRPRPQLLEGFVRLGAASGREIRNYARRWGLLDLCGHGVPEGHATVDVPLMLGVPYVTVQLEPTCRAHPGREPLAVWRYWAGQARELLQAMSSLRRDRPVPGSAWAVLCEIGAWVEPKHEPLLDLVAPFIEPLRSGVAPLPVQRSAVARAIETWLTLGGIAPRVHWETPSRPELRLGPTGLFGSLGLQIWLASSGLRAWATCSGCGRQHLPARPRFEKTRTYCADCRAAQIPQREAKRAHYERLRSDPEFRKKERKRLRAYRARQRAMREEVADGASGTA